MASSDTRLVILLSSRSRSDLSDEVRLLEALDNGGLLDRVALCVNSEIVAQHGRAAAACAESGWRWDKSLADVLNAAKIETIAVVSLRSADMADTGYAEETQALESVQRLLPAATGGNLRQMTVCPADTVADRRAEAAQSALWDCHLVCDTHAAASGDLPRRPLRDPESVDSRTQALMAGLCAAGGWADPAEGYSGNDYHDGGLMPVRFCHASLRAVYAPHMERIERSRFVPHRPPWPVPHGAGCEAAAPSAVPSWEIVNQTAEMLQLRCEKPAATQPKRSKRTLKMWRRLPLPAQQTDEERALRVFLGRLGADTSDALMGGTTESQNASRDYCLAAMRQDGIEVVAAHLERSGFKLRDGAAESNKATPHEWNNLYQLCLSLVDGGTMPEGIQRPAGTHGSRLAWTEANAIVPPDLLNNNDDKGSLPVSPPQSADTTNDAAATPTQASEAPDGDIEDVDTPEDQTAESGAWHQDPDDASRLRWRNHNGTWTGWVFQDDTIVEVAFAGDDDGRSRSRAQRQARNPKTPPAATADRWGVDVADLLPQRVAPDEMLEGKIKTGGEHDSLMQRLSQVLGNAMTESKERFCEHAFVYSSEQERYYAARRAQRSARKAGWMVGTLLVVVSLFTIDNRWPFVNEIWRAFLGGNAPLRLYDPTMVPWVSMLAAALVAAVGLVYLVNSWRVFVGSASKLESANKNRRLNNEILLHYVTELLRIRTLARQFADHKQVLSVMLHQPFGKVVPPDAGTMPGLGWYETVGLPPGLLLASAAQAEEITDEDQRRLKQVFRANWLNELLHNARRVWSERYEDRIVSGFEWPESDTSLPGTVRHRDRQSGDEVLGARSDWCDFVARPNHGMASISRSWLDHRMQEASRDTPDAYAAYLNRIRPFSDHVGWWDNASSTLAAAVTDHDFDWSVLLSDSAPTPAIQQLKTDSSQMSSTRDGSLMVLYRWELLISDAVAPRDVANWLTPAAWLAGTPTDEEII